MSAPPLPAVCSTAIGPLLRGPEQPLAVLAAFPAAVYATVTAGGLIALVTSDGVQQPNALLVPRSATVRPFAGVRPGMHGTIGGHGLSIGGLNLRVARWWDPRPRLRPFPDDELARGTTSAADRVDASTDALPHHIDTALRRVVAALGSGEGDAALAAAHRLIGAGPGLTPTGDDLLAGLLVGTAVLGASVVVDDDRAPLDGLLDTTACFGRDVARAALDHTTALSAALLGHAARGEPAAPAAMFLRSLTGHGDVLQATDRLLAVGSTSGRDLALGLLAGARLVGSHVRDTAMSPARR